jgi:hypothetical protein
MRKILTPDSWTFDEPQSHILPVRSGKVPLGSNDRRILSMAKIADEQLLSKIASLRKSPGEELVHMLAVGCTEMYGPNRNGDGFRAAVCEQYHPTFVKYARFYRNHKSNNPAISYGLVKLSHYNRTMGRIELIAALNANEEAARLNGGMLADLEMQKLASEEDIPVSMGCTTDPETLVNTSEGYKRIADIRTGDLVLTHKGRWRPVTQVMRRQYTGELVQFRAEGLPVDVSLTADHPLFAKSLSAYATSHQKRAVQVWAEAAVAGEQPFDWMHAEHLELGDRVSFTPYTPPPGIVGITDTGLAELLGIYTAEGSIAWNSENPSGFSLSINVDDWARAAVPALVGELWPHVTVTLAPTKNSQKCLCLVVHSAVLGRWFLDLVGTPLPNKRIPAEIFAGSDAAKLAFMGRWLDGDGWCDKKGLHWSSCNLKLILQGRDLLASCGISASIYRIKAQARKNGFGRKQAEYTLNVSNFDTATLREWSQKISESPWLKSGDRQKPPTLRQITGTHWAYMVKGLRKSHVTDVTVYNFEVAEDHSYSMYGLASHNCMVPFDICSYCGNKAPTRKHYCDERMCKAGGLKRNMGRTLESGDVLHADNTEPAYNDISHIVGGRQADRIAFVTGALQKMAQDTGFIAGGAELAELYYADEGEPNYWQKRAAELAALDSLEHKALQAGLPTVPIALPEFPLVKLSQLTAALADNGVILSISDFARVLVNGAPVREDLLKQACSGMFSRLRCPDINPYDHRGPIDSRYSTWAAHASRTHSLKVASLQKRAAQAELSGREATGSGLATLLKYASVSPNVETLVQQYGLYVLAAVDRLSDNSDFRLTPTAAILQNRIH